MVQLLVSKYLMSNGQYATATAYGPLFKFLFAEDAIASHTFQLADTIASDDMLAESDPFGLVLRSQTAFFHFSLW